MTLDEFLVFQIFIDLRLKLVKSFPYDILGIIGCSLEGVQVTLDLILNAFFEMVEVIRDSGVEVMAQSLHNHVIPFLVMLLYIRGLFVNYCLHIGKRLWRRQVGRLRDWGHWRSVVIVAEYCIECWNSGVDDRASKSFSNATESDYNIAAGTYRQQGLHEPRRQPMALAR